MLTTVPRDDGQTLLDTIFKSVTSSTSTDILEQLDAAEQQLIQLRLTGNTSVKLVSEMTASDLVG